MKKGKLVVVAVLSAILLIVWFNCNPFSERNSDTSVLNVLDGSDIARASATLYVTPTGSSSAGGTSFSDALSFSAALSKAAAGTTILCQAGTYRISYTSGSKNTITFSKSGTSSENIRVEGSGGQAVFDFQFPTSSWVQDSYGFYVTGSYWYFKNITITRAGYQGAYVTGGYNTFDGCQFNTNRNTGLEINKGGHHTKVINCSATDNFDLKNNGGMSDGFGPKQTMGAGNTLTNCTATSNGDDGFDLYDSPQTVIIDGCKAYSNGEADGNGEGFKLGGNYTQAVHYVSNCISSNNRHHGYTPNHNPGPIYIRNCTGSGNGGELFAETEYIIFQ
ncbi:MAG: right-handed parallel beta-helix repeat-containing protein [Spirochaetes bacterium]|nr:right-handed parallel beta-helix repeat-containing protein [Spirochaetota bacterium]